MIFQIELLADDLKKPMEVEAEDFVSLPPVILIGQQGTVRIFEPDGLGLRRVPGPVLYTESLPRPIVAYE